MQLQVRNTGCLFDKNLVEMKIHKDMVRFLSDINYCMCSLMCTAASLIVIFRRQKEIISLWKKASSQLEKRSPWEVLHYMLPFSYWLQLAVCKRQTNAILNKIMDHFHNEIISAVPGSNPAPPTVTWTGPGNMTVYHKSNLSMWGVSAWVKTIKKNIMLMNLWQRVWKIRNYTVLNSLGLHFDSLAT
jgi:hypothetical protein